MVRITYLIPGVHRLPRESVLKFVGEDTDEYFFNARPLAGTQTIGKKFVTSMVEVPQTTEMYLNRVNRQRTNIQHEHERR